MNKNLIRHTTADKLARQSEVRQLEVGQYPQVVLAYGKQLDTLDLADKWPTPRIGMDVPGGRLQVGSSLRLLITAHCGSARWVVWKGLRIKSPHPYPIVRVPPPLHPSPLPKDRPEPLKTAPEGHFKCPRY